MREEFNRNKNNNGLTRSIYKFILAVKAPFEFQKYRPLRRLDKKYGFD